MSIRELIPLIVKAVFEQSNQIYVSSREEVLCYMEIESILKPDLTLGKNGIKNGDHLMLI